MEKKQSKSDKTKDLLADALRDLLLTTPSKKITIKAITTTAGVDRQTFYYHFSSLEELTEHLCRKTISPLSEDLQTEQSMQHLLHEILNDLEKDRELLRRLLMRMGRPILKALFYDDLHYLASIKINENLRGLSIEPKTKNFAADYCVHAMVNIIVSWIRGEIKLSANELADRLAESFEIQIAGLKTKAV